MGAYAAITSVDLKQQLEIVRGDAVNFLAGEEASEVRVVTMEEVRKRDVYFAEMSDEEIAILIVETLK